MVVLFISNTSANPVRSCTYTIHKCSSPVVLNPRFSATRIFLKMFWLHIGFSSSTADYEWKAWQVGQRQTYIFGKQSKIDGTRYFMTLNNLEFGVEGRIDPGNKISCNDSRLFHYERQPQTGKNVLRHYATGYYFTEKMIVNPMHNRDKAMPIEMEWIET